MVSEQRETRVLSNTKLVVGLVLLIACFVGVLIVPEVRRCRSILVDIERLESEIEQLSASDELIARLEERRAELEQFGAGRVMVIPARNDVAGLVTELSETFDEAGLSGREITSQNETRMDDVIKTPMVVRAEGRFPQIYEVLRRLEHMPRLLRVGRLRIERVERSARGELTRNPAVSADILIEAFYESLDDGGAKGGGS